jgi:HSP20 family protein
MAIAPYRPATELFRPLLDDFFGASSTGNRLGDLMRTPSADVLEDENEIRVMVELPGMRSGDIELDLENNVLTISGEKREEREQGEKGIWHLSERRYGRFSRSFVLPRDVDQENIQAHFEDGVLRVSIPKSEKARRRRIEIQGDGGSQRVGGGASEK